MGREVVRYRPVSPAAAPSASDNFFTALIEALDAPVVVGDRLLDVDTLSVRYNGENLDVLAAVVREAAPDDDPEHRVFLRFALEVTVRLKPAQAPSQPSFTVSILDNPVDANVVDRRDAFVEARALLAPSLALEDYFYDASFECPVRDRIWDRYQNRLATEGICYSDTAVAPAARDRLVELVNELASRTPVDYHPGTNLVVRDLVHPSLFPYIAGVTPTHGTLPPVPDKSEDYWGRPYENSVYQWLPSEVEVDDDGHCVIESYINNLDRDHFPDLYLALKKLFETALPYLERIYEYVQALRFHNDMEDIDDSSGYQPEAAVQSLRGRTLQVITKIVDYELGGDQSFEGVWHVEGMSHENIMATALYILDRSPELEGAELMFKRALWDSEARSIYYDVAQDRHPSLEAAISEGLTPIGKLPTPSGRLICFPNSHVHRVGKLTGSGVRRIIVFFLVNPQRRIISTAHVRPQQGVMDLEEAKRHRMELMRERKRHKQDWNVREIELCEH